MQLHRWPPIAADAVNCTRRFRLPWWSPPRNKDPIVTRVHQLVWGAVVADPLVERAVVLESDAVAVADVADVGAAVREVLQTVHASVTFLGWAYMDHEWNSSMSKRPMPLLSHAYVISKEAARVAISSTHPCWAPVDWQMRGLAVHHNVTWGTAPEHLHPGVRARREKHAMKWSGLFTQAG